MLINTASIKRINKAFLLTILFCFVAFLRSSAQKTDKFMGEIVNYDEESVPDYTLPDVLKMKNGKFVKNVADWEKKRRAEVLNLFEEHVYGRMPKAFDSIRFEVSKEDQNAMGGRAHLKEIAVIVWNKGNSINIPVVLFTPKGKGPAPLFLLINNRSKRNTDPTRERKSTFWPAETVIDSGYAIAAFNINDVAPDNKENYRNGVLNLLYPEQLETSDGMRAIGAWAWAASRVMDYFKTDKEVDFKRVAIVGHSRGGKTALWAGAQDQRFAMVFSSCSGSTGASLARRQYGETISLINKQFGYWFNDNYKQYSKNVNSLPVDQHMLIASIAPRPVYTTNATLDRWADPRGSYLALLNARPVYDLYKKRSALVPDLPSVNSPIVNSIIGYHYREGIHDLNAYDWEKFIRFANFHYN
ncbi:alpha/beta hydrolase family protein [Desertivirga arenae]|uniref:alpha/beta hydrolase family protein n=1 Tax=Desertivirga arenae TaxID=2810309 RepID=UPI001A97C70B|nr:prolyl oligopeptidase family serine peptidase [Pedobacter sp. SYSU D00823]